MHGLGNALTISEFIHGVCALQKRPGGKKARCPVADSILTIRFAAEKTCDSQKSSNLQVPGCTAHL